MIYISKITPLVDLNPEAIDFRVASGFLRVSDRFRVIIYTTVMEPPKLDKIDQEIIQVIRTSEGLSTSEVAEKIGLSVRAVRERLKNLVTLNYLYVASTGPYDPHKKFKVRT